MDFSTTIHWAKAGLSAYPKRSGTQRLKKGKKKKSMRRREILKGGEKKVWEKGDVGEGRSGEGQNQERQTLNISFMWLPKKRNHFFTDRRKKKQSPSVSKVNEEGGSGAWDYSMRSRVGNRWNGYEDQLIVEGPPQQKKCQTECGYSIGGKGFISERGGG